MAEKAFVIVGLDKTIKDLKKFDKKAVAEFNKVVRENLREAKEDAIAQVPFSPLSNWVDNPNAKNPNSENRYNGKSRMPKWNPSEVREGIKSTRSEGKVQRDYTTSVGALKNQSKSGAGRVFELAGRHKKPPKGGRGASFIPNLEAKFGEASRVVWKAVDHIRPKFERDIKEALEKAKSTLQRDLNTNK